MLAASATREAERLAYLLHRLRYPAAPPLLLTDAPEDLELVSVASDLHRVLPRSSVAAVIADLEAQLAFFAEYRALPRFCAQCQRPIVSVGTHFCDAACRTAYYETVATAPAPAV